MDIGTLISTLVGGICTLAGAFGTIYLTTWFDSRKEKKAKCIEKIEAIEAYMPQLKRWYQEETDMYWDVVQEECAYDPRQNKYDCPFYKIENIVNWWLPTLRESVQEISTVVLFFEDLRGYEGAREYTPTGNMVQLKSDLQKYGEMFRKNYDHIWNAIGAEAKKAVS